MGDDTIVRQEMQELCDQLMVKEAQCSVDEYIEGDDDLPFCFEADDDCWDTDFFSSMFPANQPLEEPEEESENESHQPEPVIKQLTHLKEYNTFYVTMATLVICHHRLLVLLIFISAHSRNSPKRIIVSDIS